MTTLEFHDFMVLVKDLWRNTSDNDANRRVIKRAVDPLGYAEACKLAETFAASKDGAYSREFNAYKFKVFASASLAGSQGRTRHMASPEQTHNQVFILYRGGGCRDALKAGYFLKLNIRRGASPLHEAEAYRDRYLKTQACGEHNCHCLGGEWEIITDKTEDEMVLLRTDIRGFGVPAQ